MNIIFAGIVGRHPYGGVAWCSLQYLLGLQDLGHRVWYLEDTGECNFDPVANTVSTNPSYAVEFIRSCLEQHGLENRWCYIDFEGGYHGTSREDWLRVCRDADVFLNLSGGCWFWRDEYARIPHSAFIDSDPAFTQIDIANRGPSRAKFFEPFDALFTFGRNIGTPACSVPTGALDWEHTWQPTSTALWRPSGEPSHPCFTTVMTWKIHSFEDIGGNKDGEFLKFLELPACTDSCMELAVNGPQAFLRSHGWRCRDAFAVSSTLEVYRDFIRGSFGEFSVAKHTYVATNSGWFSDRTECYLASGRPAVVQDTGFSAHLPTGEGLLAFRTLEEARDALADVTTDYARHSRVAREVAEAHFDARVVLPPLLATATGGRKA